MSVNEQGIDLVLAQLTRIRENAVNALAAGLQAEGEAILGAALPITPIDTGALRGSGHVQPPEIDGQSVTVEVGFGGPAAPYALYVHENLTARHNPPTQAKFLEEPALTATAGMTDRLAARVREGLS